MCRKYIGKCVTKWNINSCPILSYIFLIVSNIFCIFPYMSYIFHMYVLYILIYSYIFIYIYFFLFPFYLLFGFDEKQKGMTIGSPWPRGCKWARAQAPYVGRTSLIVPLWALSSVPSSGTLCGATEISKNFWREVRLLTTCSTKRRNLS